MTPVLFRKESDGDVTAVFPTIPASDGMFTVYAHIGQHGSGSMGWYRTTKAAKPIEYADLQAELVRQGYDDLQVYLRVQPWMHEERRAEERRPVPAEAIAVERLRHQNERCAAV